MMYMYCVHHKKESGLHKETMASLIYCVSATAGLHIARHSLGYGEREASGPVQIFADKNVRWAVMPILNLPWLLWLLSSSLHFTLCFSLLCLGIESKCRDSKRWKYSKRLSTTFAVLVALLSVTGLLYASWCLLCSTAGQTEHDCAVPPMTYRGQSEQRDTTSKQMVNIRRLFSRRSSLSAEQSGGLERCFHSNTVQAIVNHVITALKLFIHSPDIYNKLKHTIVERILRRCRCQDGFVHDCLHEF